MQKLSTGQVAKLLQVSSKSVLRLIYDGKLRAERLTEAGQYRILRDDLEKFAAERNLTLLPDQEQK